MKRKQRLENLRSDIVQESHRIKKRLAENAKPSLLEIGIIRILEEVGKSLESETRISKETLKGYAFSIFRVTTDDFNFEESKLGQDLLKLSTAIQNLSHEL